MPSSSDTRLATLVQALIDETLSAEESTELSGLLSESAENRKYYHEQIDLHAQMSWLLRSETSDERQEVNSLFGKKRNQLARRPFLLAGAAVLTFTLLIISLLQKDPDSIAKQPSSHPELTATSLAHVSGAHWGASSPKLQTGEFLASQIHTLAEGFVRLDIGQAVQVFIEAPCVFEPVDSMLLKVHQGRVNVDVSSEEGHGFTVWTPAGKFIDLGTRFGVGVGKDESDNDVVLSEVFSGEVIVDPHMRDDLVTETLVEGESRGLLGKLSYVEISHTVDDRSIKLDFSRYEETSAFEQYKEQDAFNLALGKNVGASAHYIGANGEVFPESNLTDGRINDTGFPGDWSFWLAPNDRPTGEIIIDLGEVMTIDCLQLLNTQNRHHRDRGTKDFALSSSVTRSDFETIGSAQLSKITDKLTAEGAPPAETFTFAPREARFVKITLQSFYASTGNSSSAGLNEVRIFGPDTPLEIREQLTREATSLTSRSPESNNLALGRPIRSSAIYRSQFSANRVVDGLVNDAPIASGSYSCWLLPDRTKGEFIIDLGAPHPVDLVEIQNTTNGTIHDRGTKDYRIFSSSDGVTFHEQAKGSFPVPNRTTPPFDQVSCDGKPVRYLKFVADSHYGRGAGLSELRAFATQNPDPKSDQ